MIVLNYFNELILKIIFLKIKKYYFNTFIKNTFKKITTEFCWGTN
jgi:hypothetical protein